MALSLLFKGLVIGLSISLPIGPVGLITIRRTLTHGARVGLASGLGAATADTLYGCLAAFGVSLISDLIVSEQTWMWLIGAIILSALGIKTILSRPPETRDSVPTGKHLIGAFTSVFFLTLTNPMTILVFAGIIAGIGGVSGPKSASLLVLGVFIGALATWFALSGGVALLRNQIIKLGLGKINKASGVIILVFGLLLFVKLLTD